MNINFNLKTLKL